MRKVVSFSGERTSAYLCYLMIQKYGKDNVDFIFMDTGAEHPKTYEFIRKVDKEFGLNLICLRTKFNIELGKANSYTVVDINDCKHDLAPWREMMQKYGTPYNPGGAFCTDRMKLVPFTKYLNNKYGKGNYETYLGIREDEPKRLKPREGIVYMASISDFDKQDVLEWWEGQDFNLDIPEYLGNCVFCIKKGANKIALAAKEEPELAVSFWDALNDKSVRIVEQRKSPSLEMYRGRQSFGQVIATFKDFSKEDIESKLRGSKSFDTGSCSESCEVFNNESGIDIDPEPQKYNVIYADPPWSFNNKKTGGGMSSGAESIYPVMTINELKNLDINSLAADNCLLIMWYVGSQPQEALDLCKAWGFTVKNMNGFVWNKLTKKDKPFFGMGFYTRAGSESALIAVKGKASLLIKDHSVRAVRSARVGAHSAKPLEFRDDIVKMCGDVPRLEMFARTAGDGWDVFGNQVNNSIEIGVKS